MIAVEWLSPDDARVLRRSAGRVVVAQTRPLVRALGRDGRVAILFYAGQFAVEWIPLAQFEELQTAQMAEIRRLAASPDR